tara:strand:+ start:4005 stop:4616 length:612 start_codon:yes stop_codon:yes gene_type:complete
MNTDIPVFAARGAVQPSNPDHLRVLLMFGFTPAAAAAALGTEEGSEHAQIKQLVSKNELTNAIRKDFSIGESTLPNGTQWLIAYTTLIRDEETNAFDFYFDHADVCEMLDQARSSNGKIELLGGVKCQKKLTVREFREQIGEPMQSFFSCVDGFGSDTRFLLREGNEGLSVEGTERPIPEACRDDPDRANASLMNFLTYDPMY